MLLISGENITIAWSTNHNVTAETQCTVALNLQKSKIILFTAVEGILITGKIEQIISYDILSLNTVYKSTAVNI